MHLWQTEAWQKIVRPIAWAVLVLLLVRIGLRAAMHSVTEPAGRNGDVAAAVFDKLEQGVVVAEPVGEVAAQFAVRNAGQRRLVIQLVRRACCEPAVEPLVLAPGQSGALTVRVAAADLMRQGEHRQAVTTNDPRQPEIWLTMKLANEPTPAALAAARSSPRAADRSVLVKRP
jgi:hypothetical protein